MALALTIAVDAADLTGCACGRATRDTFVCGTVVAGGKAAADQEPNNEPTYALCRAYLAFHDYLRSFLRKEEVSKKWARRVQASPDRRLNPDPREITPG
jgi:hypothetical protein